MNRLFPILYSIRQFLWNGPMLVLLLGTHLYFTIKSRFIQRKLPKGIRLSVERSSFSALATALAATIGTGNIIGISTAIAIGGPGAVFWCWMTGLLGVATCYAECLLSGKYRVRQQDGTYRGGPMYVMESVLHQKSAAILFAVSVILVSLGMGSSVQSHAICAAMTEHLSISHEKIGVVAAILTAFVIFGGGKQIAKVCTWLVPIMSVLYFGGCLMLLWMNQEFLGEALVTIIRSAFGVDSVAGGAVGSLIMIGVRIPGNRYRDGGMSASGLISMQSGIARGLFTNEAGLGSIPIAAASADTDSPEQQSLVSMTGPFWDTVVMCAVTGITIVSCMVKHPEQFEGVRADRLCFVAFDQLPVVGSEILSLSLVLFAFATIIGWHYYGESAIYYLAAGRGKWIYQVGYIAAVYAGAVLSLDMVWTISDLFNVFMTVPNLLCLWILRREVTGYCSQIDL